MSASPFLLSQDWFASAFHADCLVALQPDEAGPWLARGDSRARLGRWAEARDDLAEAARRDDRNLKCWRLHAMACLGADDRAGFGRACREMFARFGDTDDPNVLNTLAWTPCVVAPPGVEVERCVKAAEKAAAAQPKDAAIVSTLGAVLYRAERFADAVRRLDEAVKLRDGQATAWESLVLAMAHHRLDHAEEARTWRERGQTWLSEADQGRLTGLPGVEGLGWAEKLELKLLREETERLLK
jgi:predicted Zn-dependent protease